MNRKLFAIPAVAVAAFLMTGCSPMTSDADKVSENLSVSAENFEVQRRIVGVNGITDELAFEVEGRCSIEDQNHRRLIVTCKHGPDDFRKHFLGLSDNTYYVATQLEGIDVSEYHTRIIIKPQSIIPDMEVKTN